MAPRLKDIARDLGLSTATVSNALSGNGRVSEVTRARVRQRILETGYRPDGHGRALRTGRSGVLGLVLPDISNPLFPAIAQAIETVAAESGHGILIADSHGNADAQDEALHRMVQRGADGIVIVPCGGTRVGDLPLPVAVIDAAGTPGNTVCADHRGGGRAAVRHLQGLGHHHLLLLGQTRRSVVQQERIAGMQDGLAPAATARTLWLEDDPAPDLAALVRTGATAILATSDLIALAALTRLQGAGLAVPGDVSVMGFDDLAFSAHVAPGLTTLAQDMDAIARAAVDALTARLNGDPPPPPRTVPMRLVTRGSTGPARNGQRQETETHTPSKETAA